MIVDARTVAWKEFREILSRGGPRRRRQRTLFGAIAFPVALGLLLGFEAAHAPNGLGRGFAVFPVGLLAMGTTTGLITDAIAGERERHTLETLLASPVSDTAILVGKLAAVVGYAWAISMAQLVAVGLASLTGQSFSPVLLAIVAVLSLLEATLAAGFGVQFSLRAATVRAASRKQAQYSVVINLVASGVNILAVARLSGWVRAAAMLSAVVVLVSADVALLSIARARFRRGRLLLD